MKRMRRTAVMLAAVLAAGGAWANNLVVTNVTVTPKDATTAYVQFDLSWENSWRYDTVNHDAAWVFFKVQKKDETVWNHVTLVGSGTTPDGYATGTPVGASPAIEIVVPAAVVGDVAGVGMFVRRAVGVGEGSGTVTVTGVKAVWNFASSGLAPSDKVKMQAFAVEMVYAAQGSFYVGSGSNETGSFTAGPWSSGNKAPFDITSEAAITVANSAGNLYYSNVGGNVGDGAGPIPDAFPKGYNAFYCMKYEITQGQWVDFFNTLTAAQKTTRDITSNVNDGKASDLVVRRNTVAWDGTQPATDATCTRPDRACNFLSWADVCAFADWAGLRPMTELEFEKACRGPLPAEPGEYAWGTNTIVPDVSLTISTNPEDGTETITLPTTLTNGAALYGVNNFVSGDGTDQGPLRAGIFATSSSTRVSAGASYWGIMELSGNLWERTVTVGHATGRLFTGLHGDGVLTAAGDADFATLLWPGSDAVGAGWRGACWGDAGPTSARVSDRLNAAIVRPLRNQILGGRAVRSAP